MTKADFVRLLRQRADQKEREAHQQRNNASLGGKAMEALELVALELRALANEIERT